MMVIDGHIQKTMKIQASLLLRPTSAIAALLFFFLAASTSSISYAEAFVPSPSASSTKSSSMTTSLRAEIGESGVAFEHVAREWRCKYSPGPSGGPGDSASLKACQSLLSEYLPALKALPGATITRQVCGGCLDFKVSITQPLKEHGEWASANYDPLESEFLAKLRAIEGTSMHETQEITFETL